jgi:hypothetical protein
MRRPLIKGFESPLICPSGSLDFVLDDLASVRNTALAQNGWNYSNRLRHI